MYKKLLFWAVVVVLVSIVGTCVMYLTLPENSSQTLGTKQDNVKVLKPIDLAGKWESTTSKTGAKMIAEIKDNTIFIEMYKDDGYTGLWYGTFDILQPGENAVNSKAISDNQNHFVLSTAETKKFRYQEKSLFFDYSVMGTRTTVELKRV